MKQNVTFQLACLAITIQGNNMKKVRIEHANAVLLFKILIIILVSCMAYVIQSYFEWNILWSDCLELSLEDICNVTLGLK